MSIQSIVAQTNQLVAQMNDTGKPDKRVLAVAVEINQRYLEYLEELESMPSLVHVGVDVEINGQIIHFDSLDDFSSWVAESL